MHDPDFVPLEIVVDFFVEFDYGRRLNRGRGSASALRPHTASAHRDLVAVAAETRGRGRRGRRGDVRAAEDGDGGLASALLRRGDCGLKRTWLLKHVGLNT